MSTTKVVFVVRCEMREGEGISGRKKTARRPFVEGVRCLLLSEVAASSDVWDKKSECEYRYREYLHGQVGQVNRGSEVA